MKSNLSKVEDLVKSWDVPDVCNWLNLCGLGDFVTEFTQLAVRGDFLLELIEMEDKELMEVLFRNKRLHMRKFKCDGRWLKLNGSVDVKQEQIKHETKTFAVKNDGTEDTPTIVKTSPDSPHCSSSSSNDKNGQSHAKKRSHSSISDDETEDERSNDPTSRSTAKTARGDNPSPHPLWTTSKSPPARKSPIKPLTISHKSPSVVSIPKRSVSDNGSGNGSGCAVGGTTPGYNVCNEDNEHQPAVVIKRSTQPTKRFTPKDTHPVTPEHTTTSATPMNALPALSTQKEQQKVPDDDPRGPPITLTRSIIEDVPFNWYYIKSSGLSAFYYVTVHDKNGDKYTSTKALKMAGLKEGVDYFDSESGAFDKAIKMFEKTVNYVKYEKTENIW